MDVRDFDRSSGFVLLSGLFQTDLQCKYVALTTAMIFEIDTFQFGNIILRFGSSTCAMKTSTDQHINDVGCKTVTTTAWIAKATLSTQKSFVRILWISLAAFSARQ